jgi:hypothetical protein
MGKKNEESAKREENITKKEDLIAWGRSKG